MFWRMEVFSLSLMALAFLITCIQIVLIWVQVHCHPAAHTSHALCFALPLPSPCSC